MNLLVILSLFVVGASTWTIAEYLMHRFAMHERRGRNYASRQHLRHHAGLDHDAGTTLFSWLGVITVGLFVHGPIGFVVAGWWGGVAFAVGWVCGYGLYEYLHWAAHRYPPRTTYEGWLRRHHFHHHFGAPLKNHGVTTSLWDHVFGTYEDPGRIRVPRRLAMEWLVDADGEVRAEFAEHYEVVGRAGRDAERTELDRIEAFANQAPTV